MIPIRVPAQAREEILAEQLLDLDDAISRTHVPGIVFHSGILSGAVFVCASVYPYRWSTSEVESNSIRGRYHWPTPARGPLSMQLYNVARDAFETLLKQSFTFDGHRTHAKFG